ncbi:hypothetical protein, partial [Streptomyces sp. WAC06614]|uniref:hypothetical protein n=1 Tax=Streptomyces sp. WAC06614 TaxID=2487416 RepID=UPI00163CCEE1
SFTSGRLTYLGLPMRLAETVYLHSWRSTPLPDGVEGADPVGCEEVVAGGADPVGCEEVVAAMALTWPGFPDLLRDVAAAEILGTLPPADGGPPLTAASGWPALSAALAARPAELGLPADRAAAQPYAHLLRPAERALPWAEAGPLLATRLWRTTALLDQVTPLVAALRDHPAFAATAAALAGARAGAAGEGDRGFAAAAEQRETQAQCGRLLAAWQVTDRAELLPALRARGFLDLGDFVHAVRSRLDFLVAGAGAGAPEEGVREDAPLAA